MLVTATDLRNALAAAGLRGTARAEEVTGSTNRTALEMASTGAPEWSIVAAGHQTEGRGRLGRSWDDVAGRALLFSLILRPGWLAPDRVGLLSLLAGAVTASAVQGVGGPAVRCKWPNDLLVGARKTGGILAESVLAEDRVEVVVVGIGLNLEPPSSVAGAAGIGDVDPVALLSTFLRRFAGIYGLGADGFVTASLEAWREVADTLGREVQALSVDGVRVRGRAVDVDERGALVLETADGPALVAFGEIANIGR